MYNGYVVPLRWGFKYKEVHVALIATNFFLDVAIYYVKIVLTAVTPFEDGSKFVEEPSLIWRHYLNNGFVMDALACFPLEFLAMSWEASAIDAFTKPHYRWNRVLNVVHLPQYFHGFFANYFTALSPVVIRMLQFLICCFYLAHFVACTFNAILVDGGGYFTTWFPFPTFLDYRGTHRYCLSFDWTVKVLSGYGHRLPVSDGQVIFTLVACVIGFALFATVIAYFTALVTSLNANEDQFRQKLEEIHEFFDHNKTIAASQVRAEIVAYY
eukprot:gene11256-17317_t